MKLTILDARADPSGYLVVKADMAELKGKDGFVSDDLSGGSTSGDYLIPAAAILDRRVLYALDSDLAAVEACLREHYFRVAGLPANALFAENRPISERDRAAAGGGAHPKIDVKHAPASREKITAALAELEPFLGPLRDQIARP